MSTSQRGYPHALSQGTVNSTSVMQPDETMAMSGRAEIDRIRNSD